MKKYNTKDSATRNDLYKENKKKVLMSEWINFVDPVMQKYAIFIFLGDNGV